MNTTMERNTTAQPLSASSIMGTTVRNAQDENIGDIKELMIDPASGDVRYAVLDFGGFLGVGNKLFAVPFTAFQVDRENEKFVLNVDKETLKNAEGFDQNNWPDFTDRQYEERVYNTYGVTPHWNRS